MKKPIKKMIVMLFAGASLVLNAQEWNPTNANPSTTIYRQGRVGINMTTAPTLYPLQVSGGIGMDFGDYLGCNNLSFPANSRKILQTGLDSWGDHLLFFTPGSSGALNSVEKMKLTYNGSLILGGDAAAIAKLHVAENDQLGSTSMVSTQMLASFQSNVGAGNKFKNNLWVVRDKTFTTSNNWYSAKMHDGFSVDNTGVSPANNDTQTWWERFPAEDIQSWGHNAITHMKLYKGRLGLNGTALPAGRLDVSETDGGYIAIIARAYHNYDYGYCMQSRVSRDLTKAFGIKQENYGNIANNAQETFVIYGNGETRIATDNLAAFSIRTLANIVNFKVQSDGKTTIGAQTVPSRPASLLTVSGEIDCKSLYVLKPTTWQDRVFENNYELLELGAVEKYIAANKHLPGLKSEKEILESGYDVNEIDAVLLEKIENLYLYIIKQQKEIEELKCELKKMR